MVKIDGPIMMEP